MARIDYAPGNERGYYLHTDHLTTPRLATDGSQRVVWRYEGEAFGASVPNEDPDGDGVRVTINLRFPGQYYDAETGLHYNWHRYYDPKTGRYITSDPIGLEGGLNTYAYTLSNPMRYADPTGLDVELCSRPFYPTPPPYARHCYLRFNGNNKDTLSFDPSGVHVDPAPDWWPKSCSTTKGDQNDDCVRREMKKCKASQYNFTGFNCCHCAEQAMKACGLWLPTKDWPNWPVNPGPKPGEPKSPPPSVPPSLQGAQP
jgi:RHS repeat-associated protein